MRVAITGGLGFIGRACIARLRSRGCEAIRVLDNLEPAVHGEAPDPAAYTAGWGDEVQWIRASVTDRGAVERLIEGADAVLHLAALTSVPGSAADPAAYSEVNVSGTAHLAELLPRHPSVQRVVLASSRAVYGEGAYRCRNGCPVEGPVVRSAEQLERGAWDPVCPHCDTLLAPLPAGPGTREHPVSVYGVTKLAQERLLDLSLPRHAARLAIYRFQNAYGPGQQRAVPDVGVANILTARALRGDPIRLHEDGQQVRDFVWIDDVAELLVGAAFRDAGPRRQVFDVGTGSGTTLRELAETIFEIARRDPEIEVSGEYRLGDVRHCLADPERLAAAHAWRPVSLKDGIARLVEALRQGDAS